MAVKYNEEEFVLVIGGYTSKLEYSANIELFKVAPDGTLTVEDKFELPADRVDAEDISKKKGDLGCMYYRCYRYMSKSLFFWGLFYFGFFNVCR